MALSQLYGTFSISRAPTILEAIGILLVFLFWNGVGLYILFFRFEDQLSRDNPLDEIAITIQYLGTAGILIGIDFSLFSSQGLVWVVQTAIDYQAAISLLFSGLLVLLYYDQHQTQRRQVQLMEQQANLSERRMSWQEFQEKPKLNVSKWNFAGEGDEIEIEDGKDLSVNSVASALVRYDFDKMLGLFAGTLSNHGESSAESIHLYIEVLVRTNDRPWGYIHLNNSYVFIKTDVVRMADRFIDQHLNRQSISVPAGDTVEVLGGIAVIPIVSPEEPVKNIGDLIRRLPFEVHDTVFRASISYEGPAETKHEEPIAAVRLPATEIETLAEAFEPENRVEYDGFQTLGEQASERYIRERYADITEKADGHVQSVNYKLDEDSNQE